jgi:glycosyltransferase involved in cell wall biosynthesis
MKIAIAHEWLTNMGGSEKVTINFKDIYPNAPVYTLLYNPDNLDQELRDIEVVTSFLQKFKKAKYNHQKYLPLMPFAWEQFDFSNYDVVLSSSSSCAKGIITSPATMHVCYCHSPMRYAWEFYWEYINRENVGKMKSRLIALIMNYIRLWDVTSSKRVDYYIANSQNVARRIYKHYRREADVIHPPVKTKYFTISDNDDDYYLIVARLVGYKRLDLAVEAFNELKKPLIIIGEGSQMDYLKSIAKDNIKFLGRQSDDVIKDYYAKCRAFIFPGEEDFGITPVEAQASGRPVIAFKKGGALETILENDTGVFFEEQTVNSVKDAINKFENIKFDKRKIRKHALEFDEEIFKSKIKKYINEKYIEYNREIEKKGNIYL